MELQRRFEHGSRRGRSWILFAGYFSDGQGENNDVGIERITTTTTTSGRQRHRCGIENFSQRHDPFSNYSERSRSQWQEEGKQRRAHFNQALIELKTRILLREQDRRPKFYATVPPTNVILQVIRA